MTKRKKYLYIALLCIAAALIVAMVGIRYAHAAPLAHPHEAGWIWWASPVDQGWQEVMVGNLKHQAAFVVIAPQPRYRKYQRVRLTVDDDGNITGFSR